MIFPMLFLWSICAPPVGIALFFLTRMWFQRQAVKQSPKLRKQGKDGKHPVIVGFFHPYCNAGGGGERVLWCAIRALQKRYSFVRCVVYTGDSNVTGEEIIRKAKQRFNISVSKPVTFVFLKKRYLVEANTYPYFTLLGQSLGSMILGWEALTSLVPDVYIDSMGYAFTVPLFKFLAQCKVGCYVHYPTISTDMLVRVAERRATYNNPGFIARNPILSRLKIVYYSLFAYVYGVMGARCHVVMVNSTWTQRHILDLWKVQDRTSIVYPPCDTEEFLKLPLNADNDSKHNVIVSVAQFRPEKDHQLQINAFAKLLGRFTTEEQRSIHLELIGSCRNREDADRVDELRVLCESLKIRDNVNFLINVSFEELKSHLNTATVGLHSMWNEHFGIGVVECMAAGTVIVAHDSGGPKLDIVVPYQGKPTGRLASDVEGYADTMESILRMSPKERMDICINARAAVERFSEQEFNHNFLNATEPLFT